MGLKKHVCNFCGKEYENYFEESKYCSTECYDNFRKKNAKLIEKECPICGALFKPRNSDIVYCSKKCAGISRQNRIECVCENCGKTFMRPKYMAERHARNFCSQECSRNALFWSKEDEQILIDNYGKVPYSEIINLISRDINAHSITRKAVDMGIAKERPYEQQSEGYQALCRYVRRRIHDWVSRVKKENNYTCAISGEKQNVVVHHIRSFNLIIEECINILGFNIRENFNDYQQDELDNFVDLFLETQEYYGEYICISEKIHKLFHCQYGLGNNTKEQWNEFIKDYKI